MLPFCLNYQEHAKHYLQSFLHQEKKRTVSFPFQTLPWMSHLHRHKQDQKDLSISTIFDCKETHARILACTQTLIHTGTHTLILYIQTESNRVFWAATNRPTRAQERGLSSLAKWCTTHPIHQLPSGYVTQIQGQLTVHKNTFSNPYTTLAQVVVRAVWWGNRFPTIFCGHEHLVGIWDFRLSCSDTVTPV